MCSFVLDTDQRYIVEDRYPASIQKVDGGYQITFAEQTLNILSIAQSAEGTKAVLGAGLKRTKRRRLVVAPSPLCK